MIRERPAGHHRVSHAHVGAGAGLPPDQGAVALQAERSDR